MTSIFISRFETARRTCAALGARLVVQVMSLPDYTTVLRLRGGGAVLARTIRLNCTGVLAATG